MFDRFYFDDGLLPDNKAPADYEFQTKGLDCELDKYFVSANRAVKKVSFYGGEDATPINATVEVYSHEFMYDNAKDILNRKYLGSKYQKYKIVIADSKLVHVEKLFESGYEPSAAEQAKGQE